MESSEENYNVLCFTEHFLCEDEAESVKLNGYTVASYFVRKQHIHGGAIIFCKDDMSCKQRCDLVSLSSEMNGEIAAIEIISLNLIVLTLYRPPGGDFNIFLDIIVLLLDRIAMLNKYIILNGDFNIQFNQNNTKKHTFLDAVHSFGLIEQIFENTRYNACIDNIFVNFANIITFNVNVFNPLLSDHNAVNINIDKSMLTDKCTTQKGEYISYRQITRRGKIQMYNLLENEDWSFINTDLQLDEKFEIFLDKLIYIRNTTFPIVKKHIRSKNKNKINWFNNELREMRENLRLLNNLYCSFKTQNLLVSLKKYRYKYRQAINQAKQKANSEYIRKADNAGKAAWQVINIERKKACSTGGTDIHANDFNEFFASTADSILKNLPNSNKNHNEYLGKVKREVNISFSFREVTFIEVRDAINQLKNKHSKDIYDLDIVLIKSLKDNLIYPLTKLFNQSIREGIYPSAFKIVKIIPVFKKGDCNILSNYRPIALIPVLSKILELLLKNQLYEYFESNNILMEQQFGFRKGKTTVEALNKLCENIIEGFEEGEFVGSTFCDLSKAFDCVSHKILLNKLAYYGVNAVGLKLLNSYLSDRTQITLYEGVFSDEKGTKHGVPQGSILGPLLFLIYVNDVHIANTIDSKIILYADDTTIIQSNTDYNILESSMETSVSCTEDWFATNFLSLNVSKTETMIFALRKITKPDNPDTVQFLGVYLDPTLKFDCHVERVCSKISKGIFLLKKLKKNVEQKVCMMAYHALIQSICSYAILVWGHSPHAKRVFASQRRAVRVLADLDYRADVRVAFTELNIMTLPSRYIFECLIYARNNLDEYKTSSDIHSHDTRTRENLRMEYQRLHKSANSTLHYSPLFYNKLPPAVKSLEINKFKSAIKTYLTKYAFYTFSEFLESSGNFQI